MKLLNNEEFREFVKPLEDLSLCLDKSNNLWDKHINEVMDLGAKDYDMTEEQSSEYMFLCQKAGRYLTKLINNFEQSSKELNELNKQLK